MTPLPAGVSPEFIKSLLLYEKWNYLEKKARDWNEEHDTFGHFVKRAVLFYFFPGLLFIYVALGINPITGNPHSSDANSAYRDYRRSIGQPVLSERIFNKIDSMLCGTKAETCQPKRGAATAARPAQARRRSPRATLAA